MSSPNPIRFDPSTDRRTWVKHGERLSVLDFGAVADGVILYDGAISASDNTFTSALMATIIESKVPVIGKSIWIEGAGAAGADLLTTIAAINSPSSIELSVAASTTVSAKEFRFGTNSTAGIQKAFDVAADSGVEVQFPRGNYLITSSLTVYDNLAITGQGYCHLPFFTDTLSSNLIGLGNFPLINYPETSYSFPLISFNANRLSFRGTSRTGSKGIHIGNLYGIILRDLTFDYFGDQAIHIELGIDGTFSNLFGTNNLLVRTRGSKAGGFQIGCSDTIADGVRNTTSASFINGPPGGGSIIGGEYGDGNGAGIMVVGGNSHWSNSFAHGSQVGWHITNSGSITTFVNCRADFNQGEGWEVDSSNCNFVGCRAHANSLDSPGSYSAFRIDRGGNQFTGCQVTFAGPGPDPVNNEMLHGFEITASGATEPNYFAGNYISAGAITGLDYTSTGGQEFNTINDSLTRDPAGRITHRFFGDVSVRGKDDLTGLFMVNTSASGVGANEKVWVLRPYQKTLRLEAWTDAYGSPLSILELARTGTTVDSAQLIAATIKLDGNVLIKTGKNLQFVTTTAIILAGSGSPEGVVAAVGGSIYMDGTGALYVKISGTGNTGWKKESRIFAGLTASLPLKLDGSGNPTTSAISLTSGSTEITGILAEANGGTGASARPYYTKAEVDTAIANAVAGKANISVQTSTDSGHSHTQN
jgi:hypothetical protein